MFLPGDPGPGEGVSLFSGPETVCELRAITGRGISSGYFRGPGELSRQAAALDTDPEVQGIYVTLNEVNPALFARSADRIRMRLGPKDATTSDADILRRRWFPIDIDPVRPSGVSSSDAEHTLALAKAEEIAGWLSQFGFPAPVRGDSGNGAHLLYRVDLPNDADSLRLVKQGLAVLDALFSDREVTVDTANYNAARIWKLYGTVSRKGDSTPERPHRRSQVIAVPEPVLPVSRDLLANLAGLLPAEVPEEPAAGRAVPGTPARIDLGSWLASHGIAVRSEKPWNGGTLFILDECPFSSAHRDGAYAIQYANGAVFAGCHHDSCGGGTQRWKELREKYERPDSREDTPGKNRPGADHSGTTFPHEKNPARTVRDTKRERLSARARGAGTIPPEETIPAEEFSDEDRAKAREILVHGDPRSFILDAYSHVHVGDELVAECYLASFLSSSVLNSKGLHVCPTGDSGKGKSDSARGFLQMVPARYRVQGSITSKALFYHEIPEGAVIIFDDFEMSDDLREVLKNATSDFHTPLRHRSLTTNRDPIVLNLPARCVWWILSVDNPGDDQVLNRMLIPWIDDSEDQDRKVKERIFRQASRSADEVHDADAVRVVIALLDEVRRERLRVRVPFSERIMLESFRNRRNSVMLLDMIRSFAALNFLQRTRRTLADGTTEIDAEEQDFGTAARLFTALATDGGGQTSKLLKNEKMLIDTVTAMKAGEFTLGDLQKWMGLSHLNVWRILHGRTDKGKENFGGLLAKCPAFSVIDTVTTENSGETVQRRRANHYTFDYEQYRKWNCSGSVWLDRKGPGGGDGFPGGNGRDTMGIEPGKTLDPARDGSPAVPGTDTWDTPGTVQVFSPEPGNAPDPLSVPDETVCPCVPENRENSIPETADPGQNPEIPTPDANPVFPGRFPGGRAAGTGETIAVKKPGPDGTVPLPGLFDYRNFERLQAPNGRCDVCRGNPGVFRDPDTRTCLCGVCYGRLVRDGNVKGGG